MKKILSVLLVAFLALGLAACGTKDDAPATDGGNDTPTEGGTTAAEDTLDITLILPNIGDQSYFDVTYRGLALVEEAFPGQVTTKLVEMGTDEAGWPTAYLQAASEGPDVIISGNFQYEAYMLEVAAQFPDIKFINFDYSDPAANDLPNVYGMTYSTEDNGYLAGVVAAVVSETGTIGAFGGMENPGIKNFIGGYIQGALAVNPDIKVLTGFVGDFVDTAKAKEIALNMNKNGADVIFHAAGGAGNGLFEAAAEAGFWAIGVDSDQYVALAEAKPELAERVLTSSQKNCDIAILSAITKVIDGTCPFGTLEELGAPENGVSLAMNDHFLESVTDEQKAKIDEFINPLINGEVNPIDVENDLDAYDELVAQVQ